MAQKIKEFGETEEEKKLLEYLDKSRPLKLKIQKHLSEMPASFVLLLSVKAEAHAEATIEIISRLGGTRSAGIVMLASKPAAWLVERIPKNVSGKSNLWVVDCITKPSNAREIKRKRFHYVESPRDLAMVGDSIEEAAKAAKNQRLFVLVESLSTLFVYNKPQAVEKFAHLLAGKMRSWKAKGIFVMVETGENRKEIQTIGQFCDRVVRIE